MHFRDGHGFTRVMFQYNGVVVIDVVVGHYAQSYCSLGSDTRQSGEVIGGKGCCVLAPDWSTS